MEICSLVFDCAPSQLYRRVFWDVSYADIQTKIKLFLGEKQASITQEFQTLGEIMKLAFGDGGKERNQDIPVVRTKEELQAGFARVFR